MYESTKCSRIPGTQYKSSEIETQLHTVQHGDSSVSFIYTPSLCECVEIKTTQEKPVNVVAKKEQQCGETASWGIWRLFDHKGAEIL